VAGLIDRAPDALAAGTPDPLRSELEALLGADRVLSRAIDLVRYASDASPYRVFPQVVVMPRSVDEVVRVLAYGRRSGIPVVFRAGGTSLNGQAQGDGILVDVRRHWRGVEVDGDFVRVRPGTTLGYVNRVLAKRRRRLGPDPASTDFATVGGVIANNSGGMRCGIERDSYRTLRALTFVLPSGTVIDSSAPGAEERFAAAEPELARGLIEIRDEIRADAELAERIRRKFEIKNTVGYRLCAFLDADTPVEIFRRLLVGAEGTLGFVAEATFETVPVPRRTATAWLHFGSIADAVAPVPELVAAGATAVELMVAPALIAASHLIGGTPVQWRELPPDSAALLVELAGDDDAALDAAEANARASLSASDLIRPLEFTRDRHVIEMHWRVREGLHGLVGKLRPAGTALIVEDVCVPPARIAEAAGDVQALLGKHGFLPGVAGHASAGNLHFNLTPEFSEASERERYEAFMAELVELILGKYDGSLKAEHGTGLNMAPFVEREWGPKATEMMWRVKALADPDGVLAPGVLLNRDPEVHLRNLKTTPPIEEVATTCVECGFCEPVCPSADLTTTPRQRIVLRREMARQPAGSPVLRALKEQYAYDGIETCAADGTCMLHCPVGIDTGKLIKGFRAQEHRGAAQRLALQAARRWDNVERVSRAGLRVARRVPVRRLAGLPGPAPALPATTRKGAAAVYLPACINRIFGPAREGPSLPEALVAVSARAGLPVWIPDDVAGTCCGTPWTSKGYTDGAAAMASATAEKLRRWSDDGRLPVVIDASSCALGLISDVAADLPILDSVTWANDSLLPRLQPTRLRAVALHPPCGARHLGTDRALAALAGALADEVVVPPSTRCCGFAGDRGFLHPELTASATSGIAAELDGLDLDAHVCSNRTCEIGLRQATGAPYESVVHVLERTTR
jgi:D-lactate dehydrogenase